MGYKSRGAEKPIPEARHWTTCCGWVVILHQTFTTHLRQEFIEARRHDSIDVYLPSKRFEDYTIFIEVHASVICLIEAHRISSFVHANACTNQTSWSCTKTTEHFPDVRFCTYQCARKLNQYIGVLLSTDFQPWHFPRCRGRDHKVRGVNTHTVVEKVHGVITTFVRRPVPVLPFSFITVQVTPITRRKTMEPQWNGKN